MAYKLGVLIVHGMGSQRPDFADDMIDELERRINSAGAICWEAAWWADILSPKEDALWASLSKNENLHYDHIRQFVISAFGDAIAYQRVPGERQDVYTEIHRRMHHHIARLRAALKAGASDGAPDPPLVVMGHSLGSDILSNYIWDRQRGHGSGYGDTPFEKMQTLAGILTFGCNIPLFTLPHDEIVSIQFPPAELPHNFPAGTDPAKLRAATQWLNFYDPDDVLGYPLKPLSASYARAVTKDLAINVGGILTSWNPLSHNQYWTDDSFTKPVAAMLAGLLDLL
jgi:hypothetical protein